MSCSVSELPSGCRLRGMGSAAQGGSNIPLTTSSRSSGGGGIGGVSGSSGGGGGGVGGGGGSSGAITGNNNSGNSSTALQEPNAGPLRSQKPCCFCCWCCCSCSWAKCLAIKNAEDNGPTRRDPQNSELLSEGEQNSIRFRPTLEEIRGWGRSFDRLMKSPGGRKVFRDFLRGEYSEENILFWLACEELKKETNPEAIEEKARFIYEDYISILSPKEVSLDSRVREIVNRNMVEPTTHTFDEAQLQIYTLMHRDSYPRFINSPLFKSLAQLPEGVSASGSQNESPT